MKIRQEIVLHSTRQAFSHYRARRPILATSTTQPVKSCSMAQGIDQQLKTSTPFYKNQGDSVKTWAEKLRSHRFHTVFGQVVNRAEFAPLFNSESPDRDPPGPEGAL